MCGGAGVDGGGQVERRIMRRFAGWQPNPSVVRWQRPRRSQYNRDAAFSVPERSNGAHRIEPLALRAEEDAFICLG
jgi:hypothetical protein